MITNEKVNPDKTTLTSSSGSEKKMQVLFKQPTDRHSDEHSTWQRLLGGRNVRSNVGTCLVVFAVPLLIPGITLTAVAFDDETGFNKYGVLHVLGMVMLCIASVLIVVGILLNITFENEVSPDDALHAISTHENSAKEETKNRHSQSPSGNASQWVESTSDTKTSNTVNSKPQVNFLVASGSSTQRENHVQLKCEEVGALPPLKTNSSLKQDVSLVGVNSGYVSSSDDDSSEDTDNRSSGSYVLPQESEIGVSSGIYGGEERNSMNIDESTLRQVLDKQGNFRDNVGCEYSIARLGKIPPIESLNSKSSHESTNSKQPNNFFQNREEVKRPNNLSIGTGNALRIARHKNNITLGETDRIPLTAVSHDSPSNLTNSPSKQNSPRARLGGFSNASALASSLQMSNSEELLPKHLGVESFGSNVSVFSHDEEGKDVRESNKVSHIQEGAGGSKKFNFDLPQSQDGRISQQIGSVVPEDYNNKVEFTAKSILKNALSPKRAMEESSASRFSFHARGQNGEFMDNSTNDHIPDMTKGNRKSSARRYKKRQAFSFPQGRSSSPIPSSPLAVRQSAPASFPVTAQDREDV